MLIGQKIKAAIEKQNLTPEQVAAHADVSLANLYRIFKRDSVESRYLKKFSEILKLPYSYFLDDDPEETGAAGSITQNGGIGNNAGSLKNQKIVVSETPEDYIQKLEEMAQLRSDLALCEERNKGLEQRNNGLEQRIKDKEEMIELLKESRGK